MNPIRNEDPKRKVAAPQEATTTINVAKAENTTTETLIATLLAALSACPQTTNDLRFKYGIYAPAARVFELRDQGYEIDTIRVPEVTPDGLRHFNVAKYVLRSIPDQNERGTGS